MPNIVAPTVPISQPRTNITATFISATQQAAGLNRDIPGDEVMNQQNLADIDDDTGHQRMRT